MNSSNTETVAGITYSKPEVILLQETGIGTSEIAARTCYDSFNLSENQYIRDFHLEGNCPEEISEINTIEHSDLLDKLAWTHFHYSILEHANLTYLIKGTSRAVLQEHARHRLQAISVRSTRYTMSSVLNAYIATQLLSDEDERFSFFRRIIHNLDLFITTGSFYNTLEIDNIMRKLDHQKLQLGSDEFLKLAVAKSSLQMCESAKLFKTDPEELFKKLQAGKSKRNVGDNFKHIVSDNWKVDMVVTFNLRSLKNYFQLRDSGAAYFQIQYLAQAMKDVTPSKYLNLIIKDK